MHLRQDYDIELYILYIINQLSLINIFKKKTIYISIKHCDHKTKIIVALKPDTKERERTYISIVSHLISYLIQK